MDGSGEASRAKSDLRSIIRRSRAERRSQDLDADEASSVAQHVLDLEEIRNACSSELPIACYVSRPEEPSTQVLRARLQEAGATLVVPRVENNDLVWIRVTPDTRWTANRWGIDEPTGPVLDGTPSVWIIPALAIDSDGYRLGQGGGFYDRALQGIDEEIPVVAIVFEDEVLDRVPREAHDRRVDIVVTPDRVRWLSMPD